MKNLASRFKNNFDAARDNEQGDIVQTILLIGIFVVIVVVVGTIIFNAVKSKADNVGNCIKGSGKVSAGGVGTISGGCS